MKHKYCPYCGSSLTMKEIGDEGLVPYCLSCQKPIFDVMYPCVIIIVVNENKQVCLIKQSYGVDRFVAVAGFTKLGETLEQTARREVLEEINQHVDFLEYVNSYYQEKNENLMCGFVAHVKETNLVISSELSFAKFYEVNVALKLLENAKIAKQLLIDILEKRLL